MANPMDQRVREAIVRSRGEGLSYEEISALLGVGRATVSRVLRLQRETSSVHPRPKGGGNPSPIRGRIAELLRRIVNEMPDATVAELTEALCVRADMDTSRSSVLRALKRLGYSRKKSPSSRWSETPQRGGRTGVRSAQR